MEELCIYRVIAMTLLTAALSGCPPDAPLPDNTAMVVLNNNLEAGECYETYESNNGIDPWNGHDELCLGDIFSIVVTGPNDFGESPDRLNPDTIIEPGRQFNVILDLSGNVEGDWTIALSYAVFDQRLRRTGTELLLEDVQPGDVYTWNLP